MVIMSVFGMVGGGGDRVRSKDGLVGRGNMGCYRVCRVPQCVEGFMTLLLVITGMNSGHNDCILNGGGGG